MEAAGPTFLPLPVFITMNWFLTGCGRDRKKGDTLRMILLPVLIILGTAGPYCAIYAVVMILASTAGIVRDLWRKKQKQSECSALEGEKGLGSKGDFRRYLAFLLQF